MEKGLDKPDLTCSESPATSRSGVPCVAEYSFAMEIGSELTESFFYLFTSVPRSDPILPSQTRESLRNGRNTIAPPHIEAILTAQPSIVNVLERKI